MSPNEDTGAEETVWWADDLATTHLQLRRVPTQVYPDNTRILSAPVTEGNAPSEGGWGEIILLVDLLDFMASRPKGGNYIICV